MTGSVLPAAGPGGGRGTGGSDYVATFRRHLVLIAACALLAAAVAAGLAALQAPVYESTAEVLLKTRTVDPVTGAAVSSDPARVMQTELQVAMSRQVRSLVSKKIGSAPPVVTAPAGQSDVLRLTATDDDPRRAARVANAYAASYIEFRKNQTRDELLRALAALNQQLSELEQQAEKASGAQRSLLVSEQSALRQRRDLLTSQLTLVDGGATILNRAVPAGAPASPAPVRSALLGGLAGVVAGVVLALLRERRSATSFAPAPLRRPEMAAPTPQAADGAFVEHPNRVVRWVDGRAVPDPVTDEADATVWFRLDPHYADPPAWEGLLARMVSRDRAVVLAVAVFASEVNFGDEVRVTASSSGPLIAGDVTVPSGNCTFRVQFSEWTEPADEPRRLALMARLGVLGCLFDVFTPRLMAVSAATTQATDVAEVLEEAQARGELVYVAARAGRRRRSGAETADGGERMGSPQG